MGKHYFHIRQFLSSVHKFHYERSKVRNGSCAYVDLHPMIWSGCVDGQIDLNLCCTHMPTCTLCWIPADSLALPGVMIEFDRVSLTKYIRAYWSAPFTYNHATTNLAIHAKY